MDINNIPNWWLHTKRTSRRIKNTLLSYLTSNNLPNRAVILVTNPRSGSTWFSDALRCHSAVEYWNTAILIKELELNGRRYPYDLSNKKDNNMLIEAKIGSWEKIPSFKTEYSTGKMPDSFLKEHYVLEKIHPQHYEHSSHIFIDSVSKLRDKGIHIVLIYLTRDPRASIVSFLQYQSRNPKWQPEIVDDMIISYTLKTFRSIYEVAKEHPGLIIDYSDITNDFEGTLKKAYNTLWPNCDKKEAEYLKLVCEKAVELTKREKRVKNNSEFFGKTVGRNQLNANYDYHGIFFRNEMDIKRIYENYNAILNIKYNRTVNMELR